MPPVDAAADDKTAFASPEERGEIVKDETPPKEEQTPPKEEAKQETPPKDEKTPPKEEETPPKEEAKDEGSEKTKGYKVPKFRLDAATARAKKAESEAEELRNKLAELESRPAATPAADTSGELTPEETRDKELERIDGEIADAMANQDAKRVTALMAESRKVERDYMNSQLNSTRDSTTAEMRETVRVNAVLDQLEQEFPAFDENSDDYNQELNDKVLELQQGYIALGRSQSEALIEAVNIALPAFGYSVEDAPTAPPKDETPPKDNKESVRRNADTAGKQPPRLDSVGDDSNKAGQAGELPDSTLLTEKEFDALPEDTKRRMRGDFV